MTTETIIYFVRHADSPYIEGAERTRGLSASGEEKAQQVARLLGEHPIDAYYSSPFERAIQTIRPLADRQGKVIAIEDDLRERRMAGKDFLIAGRFQEAKKQLYDDFNYAFLGGESSKVAQARAIRSFQPIVNRHAGQTLAIGTHGDIMTLMLNHYDPEYGYSFWMSCSLPDIYKATFANEKLLGIERVWRERLEP